MAFLARHGSGLLRFESAEDLVQGVHARALEADGFRYEGERPFLSWLYTLARRHIADRHAHWSALKRGSGRVLRLTFSDAPRSHTSAMPQPAAALAGPSTFAANREALVLAAKSLDALPDRDRDLVRWMSEGVPLDQQAERLTCSYAAVQRASLRAVERFRKAYSVLAASGPD